MFCSPTNKTISPYNLEHKNQFGFFTSPLPPPNRDLKVLCNENIVEPQPVFTNCFCFNWHWHELFSQLLVRKMCIFIWFWPFPFKQNTSILRHRSRSYSMEQANGIWKKKRQEALESILRHGCWGESKGVVLHFNDFEQPFPSKSINNQVKKTPNQKSISVDVSDCMDINRITFSSETRRGRFFLCLEINIQLVMISNNNNTLAILLCNSFLNLI